MQYEWMKFLAWAKSNLPLLHPPDLRCVAPSCACCMSGNCDPHRKHDVHCPPWRSWARLKQLECCHKSPRSRSSFSWCRRSIHLFIINASLQARRAQDLADPRDQKASERMNQCKKVASMGAGEVIELRKPDQGEKEGRS